MVKKNKKEEKKQPEMNLLDYRTTQVLKHFIENPPNPDEKEVIGRHHGMIPKGVSNELRDVMAVNERGSWQPIGDVEMGSDGFLEIMFIWEGKVFKLKRETGYRLAYLRVFGK